MLELRVHAPPEDIGEPVAAHGVARRAELRLAEVVLAQRVLDEDLLALVRHLVRGRSEGVG